MLGYVCACSHPQPARTHTSVPTPRASAADHSTKPIHPLQRNHRYAPRVGSICCTSTAVRGPPPRRCRRRETTKCSRECAGADLYGAAGGARVLCACTTRCSCGVQPTAPEYALVERARRKGRPEKRSSALWLSVHAFVVLQKTYRWAKVRAREGGLVVATPRRQSPHILLYCTSEAGSRGIQAGYVLSPRLAQATLLSRS
jgi:hypothetical protein